MGTLADFRRQYPQYEDMSDVELAAAIHRKYYSDLPKEEVFKKLAVKAEATPIPAPAPAPTPAPRAAGTLGAAPLKEVEAPGIFSFLDYFTDREGAIKRDREYRAYLQDQIQRDRLEDMKTQTGFFDRLGDLFNRGLLSARSGIKDVEAAIETDPALKKQFTEEARRYAADAGMEITGATTEQDVKDNFLRNAIPYIIEKGAESIPEMIAATNPLGVLGVSLPANLGRQGRDAAELQGRQDVSGTDLAKVAPGAIAVTALDTLGLGGILGVPAKTALGRIGKAALLEGSTEAIQSAIEYANPRVVTGSDIDAGDMFEQAAFGFLAGGGIGGGLRGTGELVAAPFRPKAGAQTNQEAVINTAVRTEFQRLASQEVATIMAANPDLTQDAAVDAVRERAEELMQRAQENVVARAEQELAAEGEAGAGVVGEGLAESAPSVSVPPASAGAGVSALAPAAAAEFDPILLPIYEAPNMAERKKAAKPIINDIIDQTAGDIAVPAKVANQIATQMAQRAARREVFDPVELTQSVLTEQGIIAAPEVAAPSSTGLREMGAGVAGAMGENLRKALLAKVEAGDVTENGQPSALLQAAKLIKDAGVPVDAPMLERIQAAVDSARGTGNFNAAMRAFVIDTVQRAQTEPTVAETATVEKVTPMTVQTLPQQLLMTAREQPGGVIPAGSLSEPEVMALEEAGISRNAEGDFEGYPLIDEADRRYKSGEIDNSMSQYDNSHIPALQQRYGSEPAAAAPATTPEPQYTPQQIVENVEVFAAQEARDRGFDPGMFREGAVDVVRGREPLTDQQILDAQGPEYLDAYKAGMQFGRDRMADAQAASTQVAAKAAPKKVKAVGTKGVKAKQAKAAIKRKPGKTVAEKVLNMAQAEVDTMPKEDMIEQTTPYDPEYETIRAKPGINATRMAKMLGPQLYGDPTGMGQVVIKEVLQNSFDATRTAVNEGQIEQGKIDIVVSDDGRTLTVKDNGVGMSPELLGGKFLEIAGTAKEGDKNAGGFGIAKMLFLYANKKIRVTTARNGRIAEMDVTGEQLFAALDDPSAAPDINIREFEPVDNMAFPDGHGTIIQLTIPEEAGEYKIDELPRWLDGIPSLELSPMFSNIAVTFQGRSYADPQTVEVGANFPVEDYTQFVGVKFPWGTAKVYITRNQTGQTYGKNMHILSNGLWQFSTKVNKDPSNTWSDSVPYRFYVDIVPSVKPDEPGYPFNFNRQNFTDDATSDFGKIKKYIDAIYAYKSRAGEATSFGNIQYFDANGMLGPVIDLTPDIPVQDTAFTRIAEGDQITVGENGELLVNGQEMPELTPDQLKAGIPSASDLTVSPDLIDTNSVMVHDNADVVIKATGEKMSIPDFMRRQFGERFDDFMRFNGDTFLTLRNEVARVMGYGSLRNEAIGVSFDPDYRGVSIRLPFSGSFINPLVPKYGDGLRAGYGIFGTMVHELAHHKVRSHNANFPAEMQDILLNMEADEGFAYQRFKDNFANTIAADYADIVQLGVELFNGKNPDITVEYRGNRFTDGSGEQVPEGAGDGGAGDVRGPSGAGSAGEPLLGPSFERTRGAGAGRDTGAGAQGGTEPLTDANVDKALSAKLTKAQLGRLEEAAGIQRMKLSNMQKRIARSRSAEETMSLAGKLMLLARNPDDNVNILTSLFNSVPPPVLQALLAPLETGDVVRLAKRAGMENVVRIDNMMRNEYIPYVNRAMSRASKLAEKWKDFVSRSPEGAQAMSDVMFYSNMVNADPALASSVTEYLKIDPEFKSLTAQLKTEKDPKKQASIKGRITKRRGEIQRLYFGATDPDGAKIAGWNDVPAAGKQIFREVRDYYRADFNEHYRLLMQRIDDAQFKEEDAARLKDAVDAMFKEASKRIIYFPLKRFGDYWVSVGKGKNSEFHMFESASEQDAFIARLRREGETREIDASKGKDTLRLGLRKNTEDASAALKSIMDLLDKGSIAKVDELKDHVFQMYLTALPEADMRRRFVHRQFKTGFSTDTLRTFANTAIASANQLGRLAYNYKFKNLLDQSYAETAGNPSKRRLDTITREMEMRIDTTLSSGPDSFWEQAANLGAKGTFLFLLSSPKSAIMNLTQLHIVGAPTLSAEFGEVATYGMMAKYSGQILTGKRIANPFRDENGDVRLQLPNFTAEGSAYIRGLRKTDPDRYEAILKAWDYAQEREVTESTFSSAANVYERSAEPSSEMTFTQAARQGAVGTAALRATTNAVNAMGTLFHHTERMGREIMYMSAFELAYDRNLKQGMSPAAAGDAAMEQATELTNKGMFDFSSWNKSRAAKNPVGKLALQMRSYSLSMTSLLFRSFVNMIGLYSTKAERLAAARVFFGVGAMTTLYGGFRASQFYALGMLGYGLYEFLKDTLAGDEEDEEVEQGYLNPETIDRELMKYADEQGRELSKKDMDLYIRSTWIPETFGAGGTMQEALGLSDGVAKKLETAADIGIPGVFGVDISNSVALTSLWHPVDTKSDDPEVEAYETLGRIGLGPSGALFVGAPVKFLKEANAGNFDKAIEATMPMAIRGFVKAQRLADEGLVVGKNRDVVLKDPSFYDTYSLAMQSLGFPEAQTSREMQMDIRAGELEREIADEKTTLLDKRYRAILDFERDQSEEAERNLRAIERGIEIYNLNYPSNAITNDTKKRSFEQKQQEAAERMYGLGLDSNIPIRQPMVERRAQEFMEEQ